MGRKRYYSLILKDVSKEEKLKEIKKHFIYENQTKILSMFTRFYENNSGLKKQIKEFEILNKKDKEEFSNEKKVK